MTTAKRQNDSVPALAASDLNSKLERTPESSVPRPSADQRPEPANSRRRILVVDDDLRGCVLMAESLIRAGYHADMENDGADAWDALTTRSYDLLITDNRMPRVTGLELIKKLRSENMVLPVILASGTVPFEEIKRQPGMRIDAILSKPFTLAELLEMVRKLLGTRALTPRQLELRPEK